MPRPWSTLIVDQTFAPIRSFQAPLLQVSLPNSPGCGTVWKVQTNLPVRTLKARTSPLGPLPGNSGSPQPIMTRSLNTTCLLYTSDAADERSSVDLGGRR